MRIISAICIIFHQLSWSNTVFTVCVYYYYAFIYKFRRSAKPFLSRILVFKLFQTHLRHHHRPSRVFLYPFTISFAKLDRFQPLKKHAMYLHFFFPFLFRISICKWMPKCAAGTIQSKLSYNIQYRVAFVLSRFEPVDWRMAANTLPKASIYTAIEVLDQRCVFVCEV